MRKRGTALALALALLGALALPAAAHDTRRPGQGNRISAGTYYSGYVDPDGGLWMWGRGDDGELGDGISGDRDIQTVPVKVLDNVVSVSASEGDDDGGMYTAALQADGSLWTWGNAWGGLLGNGGGGNAVGGWVEECQNVPVKILDDVAAVSCGRSSAAAVKTDGSLWMWGPVYLDGFIRVHTTPIKVMDDVAAVDCGYLNTAVIKTDGSLWAWGASVMVGNGYEGNTTMGSNLHQTIPVKLLDDVAAVSCGSSFSAAIKTDGSLWTWGTNEYSQLGVAGGGDTTIEGFTFQSVPAKIMENAAAVSCGYGNIAVVKTDGTLWTWGWNEYGQVGNGEKGEGSGGWRGLIQETPVKVLDNVSAVSCSMSHMLAAKTDGTLWTWGTNLGGTADLDSTTITRPTQVIINRQAPDPAPSGGNKFTDVKESNWFYQQVQWAVEREITTGTTETAFSPNKDCTVAEILMFLYRAYGSPQAGGANPFSNLNGTEWYAAPALWAYERGLIDGGAFNASALCTRAMVVEYLWKLAGSPSAAMAHFDDVPGSASFTRAVNWAVENGVTAGVAPGRFGPDMVCTRAQIVTFLYSALA